jgi:hypothetical protein
VKRPDIPDWGADLRMEDRPGVPMEFEPPHRYATAPVSIPSQPPSVTVLKSASLDRMTPVFGTASPPRGLSGLLRRMAYKIPEHKGRHWLILLMADRIDVVEGLLGDLRKRPGLLASLGVGAAGSAALLLRKRRRA